MEFIVADGRHRSTDPGSDGLTGNTYVVWHREEDTWLGFDPFVDLEVGGVRQLDSHRSMIVGLNCNLVLEVAGA